MSNAQNKTIEIFRAGTHTAMDGTEITFSDADIAAIAANYDPALHEAPGVVGHPSHDAPAYAWAHKLEAKDGKLTAELGDIDPQFAELVRAKRFKKISPAFYSPTQKSNPKPGAYYLRHIGFLGAQPPAVKGLKQVEFASGDAFLSFAEDDWSWVFSTIARLFRGLRDRTIEKDGLDEANKVIADYDIATIEDAAARAAADTDDIGSAYREHTSQPRQEKTLDKVALDARAAELDRREQELRSRETATEAKTVEFAEKAAAGRARADAALIDGLVKDGKFAPTKKAETLAFMATLNAGETVQFAEKGEKETPHAFFSRLLQGAGKIVNFGEVSKDDGASAVDEADPVKFGEALAAEASTYMAEQAKLGKIISPDAAVRHVADKRKKA